MLKLHGILECAQFNNKKQNSQHYGRPYMIWAQYTRYKQRNKFFLEWERMLSYNDENLEATWGALSQILLFCHRCKKEPKCFYNTMMWRMCIAAAKYYTHKPPKNAGRETRFLCACALHADGLTKKLHLFSVSGCRKRLLLHSCSGPIEQKGNVLSGSGTWGQRVLCTKAAAQ